MRKRSDPIGYGVIGAGIWGNLHLKTLSTDSRVKITAICDIDKEKAKQVASIFNIPHYYGSYDEMLKDPAVEAISVATPDFAHGGPALAVAEAGKHLLCEKPMAMTIDESLKIIRTANAKKIKFMVDFHNRWSPPFYIAYENLRAGKLGEPRYAYFRQSDTIFVPLKYISWGAKSSVLWFLGPHCIDSIRWLFNDEVREVFCVSRSGLIKSKGVDTPDFFAYLMQFEKGGVANMENSWIVSENNPTIYDLKLELQCNEGTIFMNPSHSGVMEIYSEHKSSGWDNIVYPDTMVNPTVHGKIIGLATESIRHFIDCIWNDSQPIVTGIDGLRATEIILAVEESARTNKPVSVIRNQI
jgi:predicted dehydrogenase